MCGIAGIFSFNGSPASPVALKRMTDAIAHRGPDGEGQYVEGPVALGHRRLAVLDLSPSGHQPMMSSDGRLVLVYNGEIYNFLELRADLERQGYQFRSRSDTEVLLAAWTEWGPKALARFNGMFAFAVWDRAAKTLTLARDRYGIKPLYYVDVNGTFLFASEIKAILAHGAYRTELNKKGLLEYFTFQNFFTDQTLFEGVRLLPAGCWLLVGERRSGAAVTRYWDFCFSEPARPAADEEYLEEFDRLFRLAVNRQLVSDVEVGAYLSGGLDSGSITAIAASQIPYIKSFTCGFDLHSASGLELSFDERETAEYLSYLLKTEHYEVVLKAGDMERVMPKLVRHLEEPRVGQSYPNFYIAQLASKFVKVVLAGTGGDELFGGYPWRYYRALMSDDFEDYVDQYYDYWQRLVPSEAIPRLFRPIWKEVTDVRTRDIFRSVFQAHSERLRRPEDYINHSLYFEAKTFLHGLLVMEDKLSMAHGLEVRVPFLDNDVVDFAMALPVRLKLNNVGEVVRINENEPGKKTRHYFQRTRDGKLILRRALRKYVPDEIAQREKQGFSGPDASWFRGESLEYVRRRLLDSRSPIYAFIDEKACQELVCEHLEGKQNRRLLIWSLLNFRQWCEEFL